MSLKKVFSTIAAAAIAVGGLAIGASAASADEATFGTAITLTASDKSQLEGHTFSAIRLGQGQRECVQQDRCSGHGVER